MKISNSLKLLAACGVLSAAASQAVAQVDTANWKCETCPYPKAGVSGELEAGAGGVKGDRAGYGDFNGLNGKKTFVVAGGTLRQRSDSGFGADVAATDLGLDSRALSAQMGQQGLWGLSLGYAQTPHELRKAGASPFNGVGGDRLTLPGGYPAASTASMPLAGTLQAVDLGSQRKRTDLGASWDITRNWSTSLKLRHDVRDGTQRQGASFFSTSTLLAAPVDQTTDQLEAAVSYVAPRMQASLSYQASVFKNGPEAVTWDNPFFPVLAGATRGQMAAAPDNQFHQVMASGGIELMPRMRLSGDFAVGRLTQDQTFLPATLNTTLAVPALPASSLQGKVDTYSGHLNWSAAPVQGLRLNASASRNQRDNRTPGLALPALATDLFLYQGVTRRSVPFSFKQTQFKAGADYRLAKSLQLAAGYERDERVRSYQAAVRTTEDKLWARAAWQALDELALSMRLSRAERTHSPYGSVNYGIAPQNPLQRLSYLAERKRNTVGLRADYNATEKISLGFFVDLSDDRYPDTTIGLTRARNTSGGMELAIAVAEQTQLYLFLQNDQNRARQAGSEAFARPDWVGRQLDSTDVSGFGVKHVMMGGKLELGGDATFTRSRSRSSVDTLALAPEYPVGHDSRDTTKLFATYKLQDNLSLSARWWYEEQHVADWHLDGIAPGTLGNLLALGEPAPSYRVHVLSLALRYKY